MPHAPSVGDSQLSSSNRTSCARRSMPQASRLCEIQLLHLVWRRLEDHLELVVLEQAVRVLAEAAVGRPPRRLHVGHVPGLGPEHAQERLRVHRAGSHLDVERLLEQAPARGPELRELEDELLQCDHSIALPGVPHLAKHPGGLQFLVEVQVQQAAVHRLELPRRARRERQRVEPIGRRLRRGPAGTAAHRR